MKTFIQVNNRIALLHQYPNAPDRVAYLRHPHRHTFFITSDIEVFHDDREIEFIMVQEDLQQFLTEFISKIDVNTNPLSCEMICKYVGIWIQTNYGINRELKIKVMEDNENGAYITVSSGEELAC